MGIDDVLTAPHALAECIRGAIDWIRSSRVFDHVIVLSEAGVRKLMALYCSYYERCRTHLALDKDSPDSSSGHAR